MCIRLTKWTISFSILLLIHCQASKNEEDINPTKPYNILWLVAEDLSPIIPPFGDSTIATPNLSRLAAEGVRYNNFYSVCGVCAPSRAAIATGMYPVSMGAHHMRNQYNEEFLRQLGLKVYEAVPPPEVKMMSEVLRTAGYYCTNNDKQDYQFAPTHTAWDESSKKAHWRNRNPGQPFFSIFNFNVTHESQVFGPTGKANLRFEKDFPNYDAEEYRGRLDSSEWHYLIPENTEVPIPPYLTDTELTRLDVLRVYSNIKKMDEQVGFILNQLETDGLLDSTIIFWYSDHGGPLPRQKRLLYDSGLKVPLIIRFPNQESAGTIDDQLISFVDLAPTAMSIAGIKPAAAIQGQAFLGEYKVSDPRSYIYGAADRLDTEYDRIRAVRDKKYKYLRNFMPERGYYLEVEYRERMNSMQELLRMKASGELNEYQAQWFRASKPEEELFDTETDPHELNNLADNPEYAEKLMELRQACENWMEEVGDLGHLPEREVIEYIWGGWEQPVTADPVVSTSEQIVVSCSTEGASIGYQLKGSNGWPSSWQVYSGPFTSEGADSVRIKAHRIGYAPSSEIIITP